MQILNLAISGLPIYLPADTAQVPFGDPLSGTITSAAPAVVTVPGYDAPAAGDAVSLSAQGGTLAVPFTQGATYYVINPSTDTFQLSATKGGAAINTTASAGTGNLVVHLLSAQQYGTTLPFKPGYTVVAENNTTAAITLFGAADLNTTSYGNPFGPQAFSVIATVAATAQTLVQLNYDWIKAVGTTGTLTLQMN